MGERAADRLVVIQVQGFRCTRCSHEWKPRHADQPPMVCPKCKSPYWDRERRLAAPPDAAGSAG